MQKRRDELANMRFRSERSMFKPIEVNERTVSVTPRRGAFDYVTTRLSPVDGDEALEKIDAMDRLDEIRSRRQPMTIATSPAGTRESIVAALLAIPGVRFAAVLDANILPQIMAGDVSVILQYDIASRFARDLIARALCENLPCGIVTILGSEYGACDASGFRWFTLQSAPGWLLDAAIARAGGGQLDVIGTELFQVTRRKGDPLYSEDYAELRSDETDEAYRIRMRDPLEREIDGLSLRFCSRQDSHNRHENVFAVTDGTRGLTSAQRAAVSAHWSAELRDRVAASEAARRAAQVTVVADDELWLANCKDAE